MKRFFAMCLITITCLITSACSYRINFVVINKSNSVLEVEYTVVHRDSNPSKMSLDVWDKWFGEKQWQEISQEEYQFDAETEKFKVNVAPNEVLKVLSTWDGMYFIEDYKNFEIISIKISGKNGTIAYEGNQLFKQFEEKNYTNRFIIYKQNDFTRKNRTIIYADGV